MKLQFEGVTSGGEMFNVIGRENAFLGTIYFDKAWNCFVWEQEANIKMSYKCNEQVNAKIKELSEQKGVPLK